MIRKDGKASKIAEKIKIEYVDNKEKIFPSTRYLAAKYQVSQQVVCVALQILETQGLLILSKGRKAKRISDPEVIKNLPKEPSYVRLFSIIEKEILQGNLKAGSFLPKHKYYVTQYNFSTRSVQKAYELILEKKIAYRKGRQIIIGKEPEILVSYAQTRNAIVIVSQSTHEWSKICTDAYYDSFGQTIISECKRFNVDLNYIYVQPSKFPIFDAPSGVTQYKRIIKNLGPHYRGTLVTCSLSHFDDLSYWLSAAIETKRPIIFLNTLNLQNDSLSNASNIYQLKMSEYELTYQAIQYLYNFGHRSIGFLKNKQVPWVLERENSLRKVCEKFDGIKFFSYQASPHEWKYPENENVFRTIDSIISLNLPIVNKSIEFLLENKNELISKYQDYYDAKGHKYDGIAAISSTPDSIQKIDKIYYPSLSIVHAAISLYPVFKEDITAVIAPNDLSARGMHYSWIRNLGIKIPKDLSIISFDNFYRYYPFPLTTVDPGFNSLGYAAFHTIIGDIPIEKDRRNQIWAKPEVVNKGSVAMPRSTTLMNCLHYLN